MIMIERYSLLWIFIVLQNFLSAINHNETDRKTRILSDFHMPPSSGEFTDYSAPYLHTISHSSGFYTVKTLFHALQSGKSNQQLETDTQSILDAIDNFYEQNVTIYDKYPQLFIDRLHNLQRSTVPSEGSMDSNKHQNEDKIWYKYFEQRRIQDLFDVIFALDCDTVDTDHASSIEEFFDAWRFMLEPMHVILVQNDNCSTDSVDKIPNWLDFDLFTSADVRSSMPKSDLWIFDLVAPSSISMKVFGVMVADRDFVYFLDRDTMPAFDDKGAKINPLEEHLINLLTPATPYYYNTLYDSYKRGVDFPRGYPYSLRGGVPTAISLGHVVNGNRGDMIASALEAVDSILSRPAVHPTVTIPYGVMYSLSFTNVAINREIAGPTIYVATAIKEIALGDRNLEVLTGWIGKKALDHVFAGVKHGGKTHVLLSDPKLTGPRVKSKLKEDVLWIAQSELLLRSLSAYTIRDSNHDTVMAPMRELCRFLEDSALEKSHSFIKTLRRALVVYLGLWDQMHGFYPTVNPVASKSSNGPKSNSRHQCAVFSVFHQEPYFLPIWIRYYSKHFPNATYILHHHRNDSEPRPELPPGEGVSYKYDELYGETHGFSVLWVAHIASLYQMRLLRSGYKCVLFTDIDEYVVPRLDKYPRGLIDYLVHFQGDSSVLHTRVVGYDLAHISDSVDGKRSSFESPIQWNESILQQRHYWSRHHRYDKPLLSKVLIRYKAGQHTAFLPSFISQDENLFMIHAPFVDKDYCLIRERYKYESALQMPADDRRKGFNSHLMDYPRLLKTGKLCRLARGYIAGDNRALDGGGDPLDQIPEYIRSADI